jgi:hypothetical protein
MRNNNAIGMLRALISLPKPERSNEAYFLAAVYRPAMPARGPITRFFTLERGGDYGMRVKAGVAAYLCEWTSDKSHHNHGNIFLQTFSVFLDAIYQKI